ncbi:PIR protein [Plasmodium yoelii]|uniref:PIR protein n=2 Tax=Plasmodium yoelii TaxID=5861 RepID=A0AAE9WL03_PLAYO|nr:PIR protein [Plasmodium yoelii]WBY55496.1 PIR protein [Plasmodium yoelii yoelii]CDU16599.1 YIR protein [Plasmodium yoelii]VTZ74024.1 PIR protein [Plasmodium yoelii]|eukprot:XP_022811610.1 PIR protein [Plasmodium yoelii]
MLNSRVCGEFESIWKLFPDDLNASGEYYVGGGTIKNYCPNRKCDSDINKIDAGCLWLFNQFYGKPYNFSNYADDNIGIVVFIMIWLGYKLNKMLNKEFPNLKDFYSKHIQNTNEYNKTIDDVERYISYIDLINKNDYVINISNENMSKLYDLFKNLCKMYNEISKTSDDRKNYSKYAEEFVKKYKDLNGDSNNVEGSSYNQILSTLSSEYTYFRNSYVKSIKQGTIPELITEKTPQISVSNHEGIQDVSLSETSVSSSETEVSISKDKVSDSDSGSPSSSILNKLISIPFIFVATLILLGIVYKYSLFGFRKRSQKQHLREKLKK